MYTRTPPDSYPSAYPARGASRYGTPVPPMRGRLPTIRIPKPTTAQWLVLGGALSTLLGAFLPWSSVSLGLGAKAQALTFTGWQSAFGKATAAFGLATLLLVLLRIARVRLPRGVQERERGLCMVFGAEGLMLSVLFLLDGVKVITDGAYSASAAGLGLYLVILGSASTMIGAALLRQGGSWLL